MSDSKETLDIFHVPSPGYQTYHADGALGGITPQGKIHISFYLEHGPIPERVKVEVKEDGSISDPIETEGKNGVIREMHCAVVMNLNVAETLIDYLGRIIQEIKQQRQTKP